MKPTLEQKQAIDMAIDGESCKVTAYAGAGKTSTLKLIGNAKSYQSGMYLAFNKAIATEAQGKFNSNVRCKTFHSLAFNSVPRWFTKKLSNRRLMSNQIASRHDLESYQVPVALTKQRGEDDQKRLFNNKRMATSLINAVGYFCRSNYSEIQLSQVYAALPDWMEETHRAELAKILLPKANDYWQDILDPFGVNRLEHDHYLKYWALSKPVINTDFILFDEAQDADPIMLNVLNNQAAQVIYVGDRHQQIYAFRGAVNAMQSLEIPETRLSQSFRFGNEIADLANKILFNVLDEEIPLRGFEQIDSQVCEVHDSVADAIIFRTNAAALSHMVGLIQLGREPRLEVDTATLIKNIEDAKKVKAGVRVADGSAFEGFSTWEEVLEYSNEVSNSDLKPLVSLIEKVGENALIEALLKSSSNDYDCVVTTAHKSKGLEFNKVKLGGDYFYKESVSEGEKPLTPDEARLLYVAATRAKKQLDITALNPLFKIINAGVAA
ncbi:UvrD-helicase domain-containing protein [Acinetobacter baumannii]|uniref:UvrD-helicase domain-containing protein n=1 Tax=Acinetobacter baumannii TaxID=470 RepID=UPI00165ED462|nr:UvrD-helicase domain-containing protein [Acinetobacter baumannii]EKU5224339.1 ATP-dependent helicase [Acinetobacter baumannii]EKU6961601.1 ATP-dependent helicase [Acinetobacter baumannii]EKV1069097.1 ATP-dependent helicase [Acinetobacter baumannii]EKV1111394.1 ATP-dependent helicase [Acinetobacter baumannii]EKV1145739.1 ATP-dependent helicase [Acinetobacter baumannii]